MQNSSMFHFFRFPKISRSIFLLGAVGLVTLGILFFIEQKNDHNTYDAGQYFEIAKAIQQRGVLAVHDSLRTFVYPSLIAILINLSNTTHVPTIFLIFLAQLIVYYLAILFVSTIFYEYSSRLSAIIYLLLCFNVFVIPYTGINLTDSLYTSITIMVFGVITKIEALQQAKKPISAKWIFFAVLLLSLGITTRPAAIWLALPIVYLLLRIIINQNAKLPHLFIVCVLGATPLYFQILCNLTQFHQFTFFPVFDLRELQLREGIENIKYATWLGGGNAQNFYTSHFLVKLHSADRTISWYWHFPFNAIKLLFFKFIGAFDFDYLLVYPHTKEKVKWLASFFSFSILWIGLLAILAQLKNNRMPALGSLYMPLVILLGWCSVTLVSALELRFTLPLLSYFIISGTVYLDNIISTKNIKMLTMTILSWCMVMPFFYYLSMLIRLQSPYG